ncbi:hypothetical protein FRY74_06320 [Vicingus serpentipes]|uniref:Uncharacterized protein n=1 Tax=Vicingus serpentipes TaxID=1926625 RepID=A0A5C6RVW8_9FLAO|nr:hypothetical protein [Vicingus serpentipes]TXB66184.1 hypothetical protein FRY74_06320 [Vicingus serpentipes]
MKSLINILNGVIAHWNNTHNKLTNRFYEKSEQFPELNKILAQGSVYSISQFISLVLGPKRDTKITLESISNKEIKQLKIKNFGAVYKDLLSMYFILLGTIDSNLKNEAEYTYYLIYKDYLGYKEYNTFIDSKYIQQKDYVDEDTGEVCEYAEIKSEISDNEKNEVIKGIINVGFKRISQNIPILSDIDPGLLYMFNTSTMTNISMVIKPQLAKIK